LELSDGTTYDLTRRSVENQGKKEENESSEQLKIFVWNNSFISRR